MKVKDLMEKLSVYDPEFPVYELLNGDNPLENGYMITDVLGIAGSNQKNVNGIYLVGE